jgi:hypothetical protein
MGPEGTIAFICMNACRREEAAERGTGACDRRPVTGAGGTMCSDKVQVEVDLVRGPRIPQSRAAICQEKVYLCDDPVT